MTEELTAEQMQAELQQGKAKPIELSAEEMAAMLQSGEAKPVEEESFLSSALKGLAQTAVDVGEAVDSYTGAPSRELLQSLAEGEGVGEAGLRFYEGFGSDPRDKATPMQTAESLGFEDKVPDFVSTMNQGFKGRYTNPKTGATMSTLDKDQATALDVAEGGVAMLADWSNFVPVVSLAKLLGKAGLATSKAGAKGLAKITGKGINAGTGTEVVGDVIDYGVDMAERTGRDLQKLASPLPADDYESFVRIAIENDIDPKLLPESVKYGQDSFLSRAARSQAEGPGGEQARKSFTEGLEQVQSATVRKIEDLNPDGMLIDEVQAGDEIIRGYDEAVERMFDGNDWTYRAISQMAPGIQLTEAAYDKLTKALNGLEKQATGLLRRGITATEKGQAQQILTAIDAVRSADSSVKQNVEALQMIGKHAFKKGKQALSDIPVDQKSFQKIYRELRDAIIESTRTKLGDDVADALMDNNQRMTQFFDDARAVARIIENESKAPEQIFRSLILNGNTKTVKALKSILTPDQIGRLKSAFMGSLIKVNPEDGFPFRSLWNALRNKKNVAKALFEPQEIRQIEELLQLGDRFGSPVLSSSGTGGSNKFMDLVKGVGDYFTNDIVINFLKRQGMKAEDAVRFAKENPMWYQRMAKELGETVVPLYNQAPLQQAAKGAQVMSAMTIPQTMTPEQAVQLMINPEAAKVEEIEGFPINMTEEVPPAVMDMIEDDIQKSSLTATQKAKRLNLLNKHGRVYKGN
jgi:hypothetical protein